MYLTEIKFNNYNEIFELFINNGLEIDLFRDYNGEVFRGKISDYPTINLYNTGKYTKYTCSVMTDRVVKSTEWFYIIVLSNGDWYPIPQTELYFYFKNSNIKKKFSIFDIVDGKIKDNRTVWYHGSRDINNFQNLDPNKALFQGDFGQGIYLTDEYAIAKKYATNKHTLFQGEPFRRKWCNNNLDIIYDKALNSLKDVEFFYDDLVADDGRKFKVKVYPHRNEAWCDALWDGWVNFKRQDCDIVIGCLSRKTMVDYILDLDNKITIKRLTLNTAKDYLYSYCNKEKIRPVFQICIYKKEVIKYFKRF